MKWTDLAVIWTGGALGSLGRYAALAAFGSVGNGGIPWGTALANVTGSLMIGVVMGLIERRAFGPSVRLFLVVGVLGGYTTFSFFSYENLPLIQDAAYLTAVINAAGQVTLGLVAVWVGWRVGHAVEHHRS
jgi:fluoride exporter